jgi:hypothetical protein
MAGRPAKEFDRKTFVDLVGLNCDEKEICWFFRDNEGKPANVDTLSRWCVRTFGVNFQEYCKQNRGLALRIKLRQAQMKLAEKSAAMAIFLGKNMLGQKDRIEYDNIKDDNFRQDGLSQSLSELAKGLESDD